LSCCCFGVKRIKHYSVLLTTESCVFLMIKRYLVLYNLLLGVWIVYHKQSTKLYSIVSGLMKRSLYNTDIQWCTKKIQAEMQWCVRMQFNMYSTHYFVYFQAKILVLKYLSFAHQCFIYLIKNTKKKKKYC